MKKFIKFALIGIGILFLLWAGACCTEILCKYIFGGATYSEWNTIADYFIY